MNNNVINQEYTELLSYLKERVVSSRYKAALSVNKELILLYHHIGTQILQSQSKQGWGAKVIDQLSKDLIREFPEMKGFSTRNLKYMRKFAEEYPDIQFVQEVLAQLTWYHNVTLLDKISDKQIRLFYVKHAIEYGWSRNIMVMQMELLLHKRQGQAITNFKDKLPSPQSDLAHYTLKDPYIFDFLGIGKEAHEREVEKALVHHMEKFILELGNNSFRTFFSRFKKFFFFGYSGFLFLFSFLKAGGYRKSTRRPRDFRFWDSLEAYRILSLIGAERNGSKIKGQILFFRYLLRHGRINAWRKYAFSYQLYRGLIWRGKSQRTDGLSPQ